MSEVADAFDWRRENAVWLRLALRRLRVRLYQHALTHTPHEQRVADWLVAADDDELAHAGKAELDAVDHAMTRELLDQEFRMRERGRAPTLCALSELARLDEFETELLLLAAAPALDGAFAVAYAQLHGDARRTHATLHLALSLCVRDVTGRLLAGDKLMPFRTLRAVRLLHIEEDAREPLLTRDLVVDERMADFLRGANHIDTRVMALLSPILSGVQGEASHRTGIEVAAIIDAATGRWMTINLIGERERGAGEAVLTACTRLDLLPRLLNVQRLAACAPGERTELIALIGREALLGNLAIAVDAVPASETTAVIDELILSVSATLFVISRERWPARVPICSFTVAAPTRDEQRTLWRSALNGYAHRLENEVDEIVQQFNFGGSAIADAVGRAASGSGEITRADLWRACREQTSAALEEFAQRLTPCYGWDDIVVTSDVRTQLRELTSQVEQRGRVYEAWGFGAQLSRGRGITALFAGPSGTGKTMAAEILAAHLDLDLYRIDLAGVVSKYIGETEKNLRKVFDAAERSGAILFFDEADALFGTRTEVRDSHDRYANLEVNYLLQRMEDYSGLAILATNRRSALDAALLRRLRFVIDFPFPGPDERRRIWERAFPARAPKEGLELACLSRLDLSGGNIKSIALNAAFLAAEEQAPISMSSVMRAAAREYTKLSKPLSVMEFGAYYALAQK